MSGDNLFVLVLVGVCLAVVAIAEVRSRRRNKSLGDALPLTGEAGDGEATVAEVEPERPRRDRRRRKR